MVSITFSVDDKFKSEMDKFSWVNWSDFARDIFLRRIRREEALRKLNELMKDSDLSDEMAMQLGEELKDRVYKRIKSESK
ncbi:MAG: hypothetical protein V1859_06675 [archaeon]